MESVDLKVLILSVGVYFKSSNIYITGELQEPVKRFGKVLDDVGVKVTVLLPKTHENLKIVSNILTKTWKLACIEVESDSRLKADEKFGKQITRYTAISIELPEICEPLMQM